MLYFGYGSNMSKARLQCRVCSFERLGSAFITGYALRFHKSSKDGSGKCDAFHTGNPDDVLWGVIDRLTEDQIAKLDRKEGSGYRRDPVQVTFRDRAVDAQFYVAKPEAISSQLRPLDSYKAHVLQGARELGLPKDYIDAIEAVPSTPDSS